MLCASSRGATTQIATATLGGSIRDETGAALPGVMLTIKSASTGTTRTVTTDAASRYRIAALDPGEYQIRAELQNFKSALRTGVVLTVGGTTETDFTMAVGAVSEEVKVRSEPPLVEPARTDLSRVVTAVEIESLPISGRNFVDFVKLSSGVASRRENVGGGAFKEPDVGVGSAAAPRAVVCRPARAEHHGAGADVSCLLQFERGLAAERAGAVSDDRFDRSAISAAHGGRQVGTGCRRYVPDDRSGAADEQHLARGHARRRRSDAVQPPGQRSGVARDQSRRGRVSRLPLSWGASSDRSYRQPERDSDRRAGDRQAVVCRWPTIL